MSGIKDLYGVLKGKLIRFEEADARTDYSSPHVYCYVMVKENLEYQIAINTKSSPRRPIFIRGNKVPNELLYYVNQVFTASPITHLQSLPEGFYPIKYRNHFVTSREDYPSNITIEYPKVTYQAKEIAIDYVRSNLFDPCEMKTLPSNKIGPNNDLVDLFEKQITKAIHEEATAYVYGGHFDTGRGIHEVHMNQGGIGPYKRNNGVYQDGGILLEFPDGHWEAIFLAFQSQTWETNSVTGGGMKNSFIYDHRNGRKICRKRLSDDIIQRIP